MQNKLKHYFLPIFIVLFYACTQISGCASIQHPTGGPRDSIAPKILKETPKNFTTSFKSTEVTIELDEYFKLSNEFKEISVSPAMEKAPVFKVRKKDLIIEFQEPLQDSTTYTINFGKSIVDNNEGNILKNYMYVLSTGNKIDSLSISGTVVNTLTKEPVLDATAFILPLNQDTLFGKKRASIFTATDSSGNFSLKYLRQDSYKIYALKEESGDRIYNSTNEQIGFITDSIVLTKNVDNIRIELFKEQPKTFRVTDRKIEKDGRITYALNSQLKNPSIEILSPKQLNNTKIVEYTSTNDTAYLWTESMEFDSIKVAILDDKVSLDTITIRRGKKDTYDKTISISDNLPTGKLKPGTDIVLTLSAPINAIDGKKFSLLQDSVPVNGLRVSRDSLSSRKIYLKYPLRDEKQYIISIGEGGFTGKFGGTNKEYTKQFSKDSDENYGILTTVITVPDTSSNYIIQLLNKEDNIITSNQISKNTRLNFPMVNVGKYYIRVIYDENKNGKWDTGNVEAKRQPEKVWNHPTEISLRANFEIEEKIVIPKDE